MKKRILLLSFIMFLGFLSFSVEAKNNKVIYKEHQSSNLSCMELKDIHLPDNVEGTVARGQYAFIGKYPNTTRYGIFHKKKEIAHIDLGENLIFTGSGGIILGSQSHRAYAVFYVSSPEFRIKIVELKVANIDETGHGSIKVSDLTDKDAAKYAWSTERHGPGFPILRTVDKERYFAIPQKEAWADLLCVPDSGNVSCKDFDDIQVDIVKSTIYK